MTDKVATKTKYLYLELILKDQTRSIVMPGLFVGICTFAGKNFILLHRGKDCINVANMEAFDVMKIEQRENDYKNMVFLTKEKSDQEVANTMIKNYYDELKGAGMTMDNNPTLIDVEKYTDVPEEYLNGVQIDKSSTGYNNNMSKFSHSASGSSVTGYTPTKYVAPEPKKNPEPLLFKRKGTKPGKDKLDEMKDLVLRVFSGEYEPEMPPVNDPEEDTTVDDKPPYNNYSMYGYGNMC